MIATRARRPTLTYLRGPIVLFLICLHLTTNCAADDDVTSSDYPIVTTFAGSGVPGILDGKGSTASFVTPEAIALDRNGDALVADAGGQRIRRISPSGEVTTVAGSGPLVLFGLGVPGGYLDGPALQAKFDMPSGIAVKDNGEIYVADTANNCIRRIANGVVSTFAGRPRQSIPTDGPPQTATFASPHSLAFDARGNLYVADITNGIRVIDAGGNVRTLSFANSARTITLGTYHDKDNDLLFAASPDSIAIYDLGSAKVLQTLDLLPTHSGTERFEGHEAVGPASAIAAIGPREFVYTDDLYSTVRYIQFAPGYAPYARDFTLLTPLDAPRLGGAFRDGPGIQAQFDQPMGIAVDASGRALIADAGNRRIRTLMPFDRRQLPLDGDRFPSVPDRGAFRIAIVGSSIVWTDVTWPQSIAGVIEASLERDPTFRASGKRLELYPVRFAGSKIDARLDFAETYFTTGIVDVGIVVLQGSDGRSPTPAGEPRPASTWPESLTERLKTITADARTQHSRIIAAYTPYDTVFSNEATYYRLTAAQVTVPGDPGRIKTHYNDVIHSLENADVDLVDVWPSIAAYERQPDHHAILGSWDPHFTAVGCRLIGESIASHLIAEHPWSKS